ncbi:ArsR family transcriptional regulator [Nocardia exalbida]|uniref:ArsR family transcriptional regulator n=1 Tax=Nocardia exalbida TaxID=290231 RepID=UPI00357127A8
MATVRLHSRTRPCHPPDVGSLAAAIGHSVPAVSQHLAELELAGLVRLAFRHHRAHHDRPGVTPPRPPRSGEPQRGRGPECCTHRSASASDVRRNPDRAAPMSLDAARHVSIHPAGSCSATNPLCAEPRPRSGRHRGRGLLAADPATRSGDTGGRHSSTGALLKWSPVQLESSTSGRFGATDTRAAVSAQLAAGSPFAQDSEPTSSFSPASGAPSRAPPPNPPVGLTTTLPGLMLLFGRTARNRTFERSSSS